MKRIITLAIVSVLAFQVNAQFQKGDKVVGFGLNFQSGKEELSSNQNLQTSKSNALQASIELGFAHKENLLSGFFLGSGFSKSKYEIPSQPSLSNSTANWNISGGYFNRIYKNLGKSFFVFGEGRAALSYAQQNASNNPNNPDLKQYAVNLGLYPGLAYKWNQRFLFELRFADFISAGYSYTNSKTVNNQTLKQNNVSVGTSLGLGYLNNIGIGARWTIK